MEITDVKVENFNGVVNQFKITTDSAVYFQSYDSIIAIIVKHNGSVVLGPNWKYSRTTSKYRNMFLNEDTKTTQKKLDNGEYLLDESL